MIAITIVYMLVNIAYYAVVDKDTILHSGRIVAALFFGRLWGQWTERVGVSYLALLAQIAHCIVTDLERDYRVVVAWQRPCCSIHSRARYAFICEISVPRADTNGQSSRSSERRVPYHFQVSLLAMRRLMPQWPACLPNFWCRLS